jgi:4-hydroxy-3-polyprenylbenzoate decarboxylase
MMNDPVPKRLIVGVSGASGAVYAIRALDMLRDMGVETHLVVSQAGRMTVNYETGMDYAALAARATHHYGSKDVGAPISSGSFKTMGMLVVPCSMKTLAEVATGVTGGLLSRAADVVLKERRRLVLMVRETPLHLGHLRNMTAATEIGAIVYPPVPAFYSEPKTIEELVDQTVARCLDLFDLDAPETKRWGEDLEKGKR